MRICSLSTCSRLNNTDKHREITHTHTLEEEESHLFSLSSKSTAKSLEDVKITWRKTKRRERKKKKEKQNVSFVRICFTKLIVMTNERLNE